MPLSHCGDAATPPATRGPWSQRTVAGVIGLLIMLPLAMRVWRIDFQSLSNDEIIEIEDARLSLAQMIHSPDGFPPLFRLMLSAATACWDSPMVGRWLSVCCGFLIIPIVVSLTHRLAGRSAACLAAVITSLSPFLVYYAQEARPYALYLLFGTAACYSLYLGLESDGKLAWLCFVVSSTLGAYTHYYMSLVVAAAGVAWLCDRMSLRQSWARGMAAFAAVALLCLPLCGIVRKDFAFAEDYPVEVTADALAVGYTYFSFLSGFAFGPGVSALHELAGDPRRAVWAMLPAIVGSFALLAVPMMHGFFRQFSDRRGFVVMLSFAVVPVLMAAVLSAAFQLNFNVRYVAPAAVPCLVMLAVGIDHIRSRWLMVLVLIGGTAWLTIGTIRRHTVEEYYNEDMRSAAGWLAQHATHRDAFVMTDYMARTLRFYSTPHVRVHRFPDPNSVLWIIRTDDDLATALEMVKSQVAGQAGCWIVVTRPFHGDPNRLLRRWLAGNQQSQLVATFPGVAIWQWSFNDPVRLGDAALLSSPPNDFACGSVHAIADGWRESGEPSTE